MRWPFDEGGGLDACESRLMLKYRHGVCARLEICYLFCFCGFCAGWLVAARGGDVGVGSDTELEDGQYAQKEAKVFIEGIVLM